VLEKDVSLAIAKRLARLINDQPGMKAVLTRDGDYYVGLRERVQKARQVQADLFISVHCNALTRPDMHGTAVYVLSPRGATNEHARWLANQENSADMVGGIDIQEKDHELAAVLIDLSQSATMEASFDLGSRMLGSLGQINNLQKDKVQQAAFVVLKAPDIPSVLVETAFITNPVEEKQLASAEYQQQMAESMLDGVKGYFQSYRPQQQIVVNEPAPEPAPRKARAVEVKMERKTHSSKSSSRAGSVSTQ
jgi:N-acetylmuramoyl-L-alanine amidase